MRVRDYSDVEIIGKGTPGEYLMPFVVRINGHDVGVISDVQVNTGSRDEATTVTVTLVPRSITVHNEVAET